MKLKNGHIKAPVVEASFGVCLNLTGLIPADCDCVMVLINTGSGLNAGMPQPVGFMKLTHQIYVKDLEEMIEKHERNALSVGGYLNRITLCPVRAKDRLDIWEAAK